MTKFTDQPRKIAVIGCGLRSDAYLKHIAPQQHSLWQLVGLADPNEDAIAYYRALYGENTPAFSNGPELFNAIGDTLDAVIIGSPNAAHREGMIPAARRKLIIWLEKPVATNFDDCVAMWQAYVDAGEPPLGIGFVMRYIPMYQRIRQLIEDGAVGRILTVQATEEMGATLTSMFLRCWRRFEDIAGTLLLEKCSHDLDMLSWMIDSRPARVNSMGGLMQMTPRKDAADCCADCSLTATCRYSPDNVRAYTFDDSEAEQTRARITPGNNDLCVYNGEKTIVDHQTVELEYENCVLATFTVTMDQPWTKRTLKIQGTKGQIEMDLGRNRLILVENAKKGWDRPAERDMTVEHDGSGHHGGDSVASRQFASMLRGESGSPPAGLRAGIEACLVAFAAEDARREGRAIEVAPYFDRVFGYEAAAVGL